MRQIMATPLVHGDFRDTLRARWEQARHNREAEDDMGHTITAIRNAPSLKMVEIDDETRKELEGLFEFLTQEENKGQVGYAKFDSADEIDPWVEQARCWAQTREGGRVYFRKLPAPNLGDTELKFQLRHLTDAEKSGAKADPKATAKAK